MKCAVQRYAALVAFDCAATKYVIVGHDSIILFPEETPKANKSATMSTIIISLFWARAHSSQQRPQKKNNKNPRKERKKGLRQESEVKNSNRETKKKTLPQNAWYIYWNGKYVRCIAAQLMVVYFQITNRIRSLSLTEHNSVAFNDAEHRWNGICTRPAIFCTAYNTSNYKTIYSFITQFVGEKWLIGYNTTLFTFVLTTHAGFHFANFVYANQANPFSTTWTTFSYAIYVCGTLNLYLGSSRVKMLFWRRQRHRWRWRL